MLPDRQHRAGGVTLLGEEWAVLCRDLSVPGICLSLPQGSVCPRDLSLPQGSSGCVGPAQEPAQGDGHGELGQSSSSSGQGQQRR